MQMKMFNRMRYAIDGHNRTVAPVFANDVALAIMNALKMEETMGKTYDLAGIHQYTYEDIYDTFFNLTEIKPYNTVIPFETALDYKQYRWYLSPYRKIFRTWLYPEFITQEA